MMFRRFLQRLKQHQWGAIATELAIVIIGVFIGMQVSDWNEERALDSVDLNRVAADGSNSMPLRGKLVIPAKAGIQFLN